MRRAHPRESTTFSRAGRAPKLYAFKLSNTIKRLAFRDTVSGERPAKPRSRVAVARGEAGQPMRRDFSGAKFTKIIRI